VINRVLLAIAAMGFLAFGAPLVMTWTHPHLLEHGMREVARIEVERRVGAKIDALDDSRVAGFARAALAKVDADIARKEDELRRDVPRQVARVIADMTDADCTCRRRLEAYAQQGAEAEIGRLGAARDGLVRVIEHTYAVVAAGLLRDARIVLGTNASAFLAIGILALVKRRGGPHLLIPTTAVLLAVAVTLYGYVFNQDWLHTLVYADFTGFAYVAWFGVVAGTLLDIALNKGRICVKVLDAILQAVGSAMTAVPC
jgi:hypothetical protein